MCIKYLIKVLFFHYSFVKKKRIEIAFYIYFISNRFKYHFISKIIIVFVVKFSLTKKNIYYSKRDKYKYYALYIGPYMFFIYSNRHIY